MIFNMSDGKRNNYKEYTGQMTLASSGSTITISNPFGSAEKVKKVNIDSSKRAIQGVDWIQASNTTGIAHYAACQSTRDRYEYMFSDGTITTTDDNITITTPSKVMVAGNIVWEVIGVE